MGIRATIKKACSPSKEKSGQRKGDWQIGREWDNGQQGGKVDVSYNYVYMYVP
jgi:hypothetical protein